jgi:hypothetical protein
MLINYANHIVLASYLIMYSHHFLCLVNVDVTSTSFTSVKPKLEMVTIMRASSNSSFRSLTTIIFNI